MKYTHLYKHNIFMYHESVISLHVPVVQKKKTTIIIYFTSALPKFTGPENHIFVCFITWLQAIENALYKLLKGFSNGSRSNRSQVKSAPNQICPKSNRPRSNRPKSNRPQSNRSQIKSLYYYGGFFYLMCFTFFFTPGNHMSAICVVSYCQHAKVNIS